ncbi:MAG: hypothetical protein M3Y28_02940 [Armatimonadota bacterium]|nr:hypothetical protein [Armatimonadota bacterium]
MMRSRWLSTFTLLGILLIALGAVGKVLGPRFIFDPGQIADGNECWYYMTVGALMVLNGLITPALPADERPAETTTPTTAKTSAVRPLAASTVEKTTGENV